MDTYGITPKGQQDRHWVRPAEIGPGTATKPAPYAHLRAVK
jgi:hypothetical protein